MRTLLISTLFLLASACNQSQIQGETSRGAINASAPYLWPSNSFPKELRISTAFTAEEVRTISGMGTSWETALVNKIDFFNTSGTTTELPADINLDSIGKDGIFGVYKLSRWPDALSPSALAVTQIFGRRFNSGTSNEYVQIIHADILINFDYYDFRTVDSNTFATYDLATVVLHEMGHFLGLVHKSGSSVMTPAIGTSTKIQEPKSLDIVDLSDKYKLSLPGVSTAILAEHIPDLRPMNGDKGQEIKILIELQADGACRHLENGTLKERHFPGR